MRLGVDCLRGVFCLRRMAPEILLGERYNEKIDVYAFAMVLLELTSRQLPWCYSTYSSLSSFWLLSLVSPRPFSPWNFPLAPGLPA